MLNTIQTRAASHLQAATNSFNYLSQNFLSTFITVMVIASVLTLPGLFWIFNSNLSQLTGNWQKEGRISLYLQLSLSSADQQVLLDKIRRMEGVQAAVLKTRDEGLSELQSQEGMQNIMQFLPENPLPAVIDITPAVTPSYPADVNKLYQALKAWPEVSLVKLDLEWIKRMHAILAFVGQLTHVLLLLLAGVVILIVGYTLRLAIYNRHEEIQVLKLIGAADAFILRPFLYAGVWYGMIGAVFAVLFVNIFMLFVSYAFQELAGIYQMSFSLAGLTVKQAYAIVLSAMCLGWLGAKFSVRRQMAFIEPYS